MSASRRLTARYDAGLDQMRVLDVEGNALDDVDATCLSDMLGEVVDEMGRRGYDPASASFVIDTRRDATPTVN